MKKPIFLMPRASLIWLLAAMVLCLLPQLRWMPLWFGALLALCVFWRVQVFRQRWSFPGRIVRLAMMILAGWGLLMHFGTLLGPEPGVGLLLVAYIYKLLEMVQRRDAYLIVILSYFVLATLYLFDTGLLITAYSLLVATVITGALIALHQTSEAHSPWTTFKAATAMMAQSVPLMLVLFVLVPRIGPVWTLSLQSEQARTGIGEEMSPGDIADLARSGALAFRVEFTSPLPPPKKLYWRGVNFSRFDGRTWYVDTTRFDERLSRQSTRFFSWQGLSEPVQYRVLIEPTQRDWLFALAWAEVDFPGAYQAEDQTWILTDGVTSNMAYEVTSYLDYRFQSQSLTPEQRQHYLQLPSQGDPQAREFATRLWRSSAGDSEQFIRSWLQWIRTEPFVYSLRPPVLQGDTIDQFLFGSRTGFCAHYAGATVFLLRAAGIPARMVAGYQGGVLHESGAYLQVHQYDAHAWVEAWLPGIGWRQLDPTAAIAPERVEQGPFLGTDPSFQMDSPLSPMRWRNQPWIAAVRNQLAYYDYLWTRWIVGYDADTQSELLSQLLGSVTPEKLGFALAVVGGGVVAVFLLLMLLAQRPAPLHPADRLYLAFCRKLERRGLVRANGEAPGTFAARVAQQRPELAAQVQAFTRQYERLRYASRTASSDTQLHATDRNRSAIMRQALRALKKTLATL
jgi:transglutaminase-like putative cysteine protease